MSFVVGFDMDGVILDSDNHATGGWLNNAFAKTLRAFDIPEDDENIQALHIVSLRQNIQAFCDRFDIDNPDRLLATREENYVAGKLAALKDGRIALFPDVSSLEELARDYPLGIVSNSPQVVVDRIVDRFSLERIFRVFIGRGSSLQEIRCAKPAPHLLEHLKDALGATRGYYVGNQPEDVQAARSASLVPIRLNRHGERGDIATLHELKRFLTDHRLANE
jgi:phosphoglycolate phosphatase-like HAD superfamily hydrolase